MCKHDLPQDTETLNPDLGSQLEGENNATRDWMAEFTCWILRMEDPQTTVFPKTKVNFLSDWGPPFSKSTNPPVFLGSSCKDANVTQVVGWNPQTI